MADKLLTITASIDYISGHLRYGHKELEIAESIWNAMSKDEQKDYFSDKAKVVVDDYEIDDYGDVGEMEIQ